LIALDLRMERFLSDSCDSSFFSTAAYHVCRRLAFPEEHANNHARGEEKMAGR
jgi:hypothetical protein